MFEERAVDVIVCRIAIDEFVKEKSVERKPPIVWGGMEVVLFESQISRYSNDSRSTSCRNEQ
jgi:hypothetical protein